MQCLQHGVADGAGSSLIDARVLACDIIITARTYEFLSYHDLFCSMFNSSLLICAVYVMLACTFNRQRYEGCAEVFTGLLDAYSAELLGTRL
jgi:hypothetical protein